MDFSKKIKAAALLSLFLLLFAFPAIGFCETIPKTHLQNPPDQNQQYMQIPMKQWNQLKDDLQKQNSEFLQCKKDLQMLKKPSMELMNQLSEAEKLLKQLQTELNQQKQDLMKLSSDKETLQTQLQILKQNIEKERKIQKRRLWQNRIWFFISGVIVGVASK